MNSDTNNVRFEPKVTDAADGTNVPNAKNLG